MSAVLEKQLADLIDVLKRPTIPLSVALWSTAEVAAYLCVSESQVGARYACRPEFPRPIRLPVDSCNGKGQGRPRWKAGEVIEWAERHQERKRAA
jgi:predicted DNA-binding transcriptional regulator AlpA